MLHQQLVLVQVLELVQQQELVQVLALPSCRKRRGRRLQRRQRSRGTCSCVFPEDGFLDEVQFADACAERVSATVRQRLGLLGGMAPDGSTVVINPAREYKLATSIRTNPAAQPSPCKCLGRCVCRTLATGGAGKG